MLKAILILSLLGSVLIIAQPNLKEWTSEDSLRQVQAALGEPLPRHYLAPTEDQIRIGKELVLEGRTIGPDGQRTNYISKYYACTSCHNIKQEDPDLRVSDPEARLPYVKEKGLPFLQGTTFKGIVNRESWYNDDYVKKYGDEKIERAHGDLREAIQLCAVECSQGRPMEHWEIEAVLAYYWSLEYTLDDLGLTEEDLVQLNQKQQDDQEHAALREWLRSFYSIKSPAHFYDSAPNKEVGYEGLVGRPAVGRDLYELSCLHCHKAGGVSHYILDNSELSFQHLARMIPKDSHFSLYQIIPYGTYAIPGHRPYMPHYPEERMNKQQVEDLRAYIEQMAQ